MPAVSPSWETSYQTGRAAEAEPLLRRAVEANEMVFGSEHSFVASCLNVLASLLRDTGRPAEAEPLHRRALAIREADVSNQADLATSLHNLAVVLCDTGRFDEAEP